MKELFQKYADLIAKRIEYNQGLKSFGEDSIRYDFCFALLNHFNLTPDKLRLEMEIPDSQYVRKKREKISTQGRNEEKPEIDLVLNPQNNTSPGLLVEFAFFRRQQASIAKPKLHGKLLSDIVRLAMLKEKRKYVEYTSLMVCITDEEMINYGMPGTRGPSALPIQFEYKLSDEFLNKLTNTTKSEIDTRFLEKAKDKKLTPLAQRIFNEDYEFSNQKWALWVWEVGFDLHR